MDHPRLMEMIRTYRQTALHDQLIQPIELTDDRLALHHCQLLQALLQQLLYLPRVVDLLVLPEGIVRSPTCVFSEVILAKVAALTEELSVLSCAIGD